MISIVVFDLGKVLLHFEHSLIARNLSVVSSYNDKEIFEYVFKTDLESRFDKGLLSPEEFYQILRKRFNIKSDFSRFSELFSDIFKPIPHMEEILNSLKGSGIKLALLSNTNKLHIEHVRKKYNILSYFDKLFLSYELGFVKPAPEIFKAVLNYYNDKPENILYIDDIKNNVSAASSLGIKSVCFTEPEQLITTLAENGVKVRL